MLFRDEYFFCSNFYPAPVNIQGIRYPTSEHAYQAAKTTNLDLRKAICGLKTPGQAKRQGRMIKVRPDWEKIKLSAMEYIVRQKFVQNPALQEMLLATGEVELVESNTWGDRFWGTYDGIGENRLGKILMNLRSEIRK